jgi:hypothetical protein
MEVNAFQHSADVVLQKSIREGFGLVVAEAFWKSRPVVAGHAAEYRCSFQRVMKTTSSKAWKIVLPRS